MDSRNNGPTCSGTALPPFTPHGPLVSPLALVYKIVPMPDLKVLLSREQIATRVAEMGEEIARDFSGQSIIFVGVLKGAAVFLSDLARQVPLDATFDFIGVSSYGNRPTPKENPAGHAAWDSLGEVRVTKDMDNSLADRNVILVEDILDTGLTLNYIQKLVLAHQPKTLRIATLLDKPSRRKQPIQAHYIGFTIPDAYVVGYGLDYAEKYRNLPDICVIEKP
jgi:hypoxanthine phosphoribosyltransferase